MEGVAILFLITIAVIMFTFMGCKAVFGKGTYFFSITVKLKKKDVKRNKTIAYCFIALSVVLVAVTIYIFSVTNSYDDDADGYYWHDGAYHEKEELNEGVGFDIYE